MGEFVASDPGPAPTLPQPTRGPEVADVDTFNAAFRQSNDIVSAFSAIRLSGPFEPQEGYSAWDEIKDKPQYLTHMNRFAGFRSPAETQQEMARIDREEADKRTLAASGASGFLATLIAGTLDPTMLLPGRVAVGVTKEGVGFLRGAAEVGGAMAVQSTVQEILLHASQETRTAGESVVSVGSATLLGALLGGALARLSPAEHASLTAALDRDRAALDAHVAGRPEPPAPPAPSPTAPAGFVAYHGARQGFEGDFSLSKIGTGEGNTSFGYGLYFSDTPDVAKTYQRGGGALYQVQINADKDHFLDWDKPISEQSQHVKDAIKGLENNIKNGWFFQVTKNDMQDIRRQMFREATTVQELLAPLERGINPADASRILKEAGIPGIQYLDKHSRDAGEGTRNYVIFDDSLVKKTDAAALPLAPAAEEEYQLTPAPPPNPNAPRGRAFTPLTPEQEAARAADDERMRRAFGNVPNYEGGAVGKPLAEPEILPPAGQEARERAPTAAAEEAAATSKPTALPPRTPFPENFPTVVYQQGPQSKIRVTEHPDFAAAKAGDLDAAQRVVKDSMNDAAVEKIRQQIGDRNPVLVAVYAAGEDGTRNRLPLVYAEELSYRLGYDISDDIRQVHRVKHTDADAATRIANRTGFEGKVEPGRDYYLVDDLAVQGGTLADLRSHIEANGGNVIGATTLMSQPYSHILGPRTETLAKLRVQFPDLEAWWYGQFGHGLDALTQSEAHYLTRFRSLDALRKRIVEAGPANDLGAAARSPAREQIDKIRELIADGKSYSEVAAELGLTRNQVAGIVDRAGIEAPPKGTPRGYWQEGGEGPEQLRRLNNEGLTADQIADHFGISESRVSTLMSENGIELKNPRKPGPKSGTAAWTAAISEWETLPDGTMVRRAVGAEAAGTSALESVRTGGPADTTTLQPVRTGTGLERIAFDPVQQALSQPSVEGRRAVADLVEIPTLVQENLRGETTTTLGTPPLETLARLASNQAQVAVRDKLMELWSDLRFNGAKVPLATRAKIAFGISERSGPETVPTFGQFKVMVGDAAMSGDTHAIPQVAEAVKFVREKVFEPWAERAQKVFPEFQRQEAEAYFPHVWNKNLIEARRPEFVNKLVDKFWSDQTARRGIQDRLRLFQGALESRQETIDKLTDTIEKRTAKMQETQTELEAATRAHKEAFQRATELREGEAENVGGVMELRPGKNRAKATELARQETAIREQVNKLNDKVSGYKHEIEDLEQRLQAEHLHVNATRARIEDEIGRWEGKSASEAKSALKTRAKYEAERQAKAAAAGKAPPTERLTAADDVVDRAVKKMLNTDQNRSLEDIRTYANQTVDRVLGSPDGRLAYDEYHPDTGPRPSSGMQARGSLARRTLDVDNDFARGWVEQDIEQVVRNHLRTFVPDVLLAERFGDVEMSGQIRAVEAEYGRLIDAAGPAEKERTKLGDQRNSTIETIAALRDRLRGLYNIPSTAAARRLGRISAAVKNANIPLSLGMAAVSSIPDAAGAVFRWGMTAAFRDGWAPFVKSLMGNREFDKEAMRQFRAMGIAVDTFTAQRHHEFSGLTEAYRPGSPVETTLQHVADKFQLVNMLGPWTDRMKAISSTIAAQELFRAAKASAEGNATLKQLRALGENNIDARMAKRIAEEYERSGNTIDGVTLPNTEAWTNAETRTAFEAALSREANIAVVTPGLDKPLLFSDPVFSMLLQFKSFTAAATTRIMIANLQRADAETLQGLVASLAMGMVSYKINAITGGQPTSDRPQDWIKEAMSRGNIFGWLEEGNALSSKMTRGGLDLYRLIGADKPLSKFAAQSAPEQLMGPTFGKLQALAKATSGASALDWNASDTKAMRRLMAGQNLFYLRWLFDQVEAGTNSALGVQQKVH